LRVGCCRGRVDESLDDDVVNHLRLDLTKKNTGKQLGSNDK